MQKIEIQGYVRDSSNVPYANSKVELRNGDFSDQSLISKTVTESSGWYTFYEKLHKGSYYGIVYYRNGSSFIGYTFKFNGEETIRHDVNQ